MSPYVMTSLEALLNLNKSTVLTAYAVRTVGPPAYGLPVIVDQRTKSRSTGPAYFICMVACMMVEESVEVSVVRVAGYL